MPRMANIFQQLDPNLKKLLQSTKATLFDPASAVYTNRDLNLNQILLVGFDMDYTLANYYRQPMEQLQYKLTVEYLIKNKSYPENIRELAYDPHLIIRGLVVDKKKGYLLKLDTHAHIWRATYGRHQLSYEEAVNLYANQKIRLGSSQYSSLDSLFAMPEACLYCNLIDYFEERHKEGASLNPVEPLLMQLDHNPIINTSKLFDDVRQSMDAIHSDGSLKSIITQDIPTYINADPGLALTLHKFRRAGKRLFLLTNSHWSYTNCVMSYVLGGKLPDYATWQCYFDVIIVGASKPSFFVDKKPFFEIDTNSHDHMMDQVGSIAVNDTEFSRQKVYMGGNLFDFERMSKCKGEQILYVGDHIYGDIVLSKKESLWRTCLVVEELQNEINFSIKNAKDLDRASESDAKRLSIDDEIGQRRALLFHIEVAAKNSNLKPKQVEHLLEISNTLRRDLEDSQNALRQLDKKSYLFQDKLERRFHAVWGRLFREKSQLSRFGAQVTYYACIYTSNLINLLQYSSKHTFRASGDLMSHDIALLNTTQLAKKKR
jgi:5'-nucleotidase